MGNPLPRYRLAPALIGLCLQPAALRAQTNVAVYGDGLLNGWQSYGWAKLDYGATTRVHSGAKAIAVTAAADQALYLHHDAIPGGTFTNLSFWIHGGTAGGQSLQIQATVAGAARLAKSIPALQPQWQLFSVSLAALGISGQTAFDGFWIQDRSGHAQATFYVDDIALTGPPPTPPVPVTIAIDAAQHLHPIRPEIYGVAFADTAAAKDLRVPVNRSGGNPESRYNWQLNAHNRAADFYFESIADSGATPGQAADTFVAESRAAGAEPMLTVPMLGWVAKLGPNRGKLASFSIKKYGAQTDRDAAYFADAGNGIKSAGTPPVHVTGNDPNDANIPAEATLQDSWVQHLVAKWGPSAAGGIRYYLLDNEPSLWHSTHRDVHPSGATLDELRDKSLAYAAMIKARDPGALVFGPEEWGWSGYFYSGYDQQYGAAHNYSSWPDRAAHANQDYIPWLLDQWHASNVATGRRPVDALSVHFYPQGGEFSDDVSAAMQLRRNRSTRALWDPAYVDETWIQTAVKLVPRLQDWVAGHYPGTLTALTEYSCGADGHINGATAQADVLGILGREGIDFATRWVCPKTGTPAYNAIKLYRNYDGAGSAFGDLAVAATAPDPDEVAAFASQRSSDGALTIVVINKAPDGERTAKLTVAGFVPGGPAQGWRLGQANAIARLTDAVFAGGTHTAALPAQSITLYVLPPSTAPVLRAGTVAGGMFHLQASGPAGQRIQVEDSADLQTWSAAGTNVLGPGPLEIALPVVAHQTRYYRATVLP